MAVNINVTEDENSIDINDVNVFTIHVKDLSVPGSIQVQEDVSEISEDTVDTSTEIRIIELSTDPTVEVSINEINNDIVTIISTDTNVVEVSDDIAIVTAATEAASKKLRGFTGDSLWDQFGNKAVYTEGNVGIGTTSPNHKLDVAGNINATTFTGTFIGVISSSAQIASQISGALENLSTTVTTNQTNISTRQSETSTNQSNISQNQADIANALSRLSAIEITTGSLTQSIFHNVNNIAGNLSLISNLQEDSRSFSIRIADIEAGSTSKPLVSGSGQIATEISGAFTATSHSLQSRVNTLEVATVVLPDNLVSGSAQIATEISGAFNNISSSLQDRISNIEAGSTSKALISGSAQIATEISGAFSTTSESLQSRIVIIESELDNTLISGSTQIAAEISGAFTNVSSSITSRTTTLESNINQAVNTTSNVQFANIEATNDISASSIRSDSDMQIGGDLAVEGVVFGLGGFAVTIDDISVTTGSTQFGSSSLDTHGFTGSMSITGSLTVTGSVDARKFTGIFAGALSSSAQIATEISGAFFETSSSMQSRLSIIETELDSTLISGSSQIANAISGSFNSVSASITSRLTTTESELSNTLISGSSQLATEISGAFHKASSSFEGRLTTVETELNNTLISGSKQISTEISGAFFESSQSITSRLTTVESELSNTLISSSAQIATEISGAFNNIDFDPGFDTGVVVYDNSSKRFYFTSSYGEAGTSVVTSTGTTTQYATSSIAPAVNLSKLVINDFSDTVSVKSDGGILELTFGTPVDPFFATFAAVGFNPNRFNKQTDDYSIKITVNLSGNSFVKGELSASTNGLASTGVTTFTADSTINIDSNFPSYQSGSHIFTARAFINDAVTGVAREISEVLDLQLAKTDPSDPTIQFTNFGLSGNSPAHNVGDMEIEEGATGTITFNLIEGDDQNWTAAAVHNSTFSPSITVSPLGNITTGRIEEYWNSGNDNDPQIYRTGSAERIFTRVRSLRYKTDASPSIPDLSEMLTLNSWTGTIEAGVDQQNEIESILVDVSPDSEYIFIAYDIRRGNLQKIENTLFGNQNEIDAFERSEIGDLDDGFIMYRTKLPKRNQFIYKLVFP